MSRTMYLVRRFVVYPSREGSDVPYLEEDSRCSDAHERWHPCAVYADRSDAEADARERNRQVRQTLNPHWLRGCLDALPEVPLSDLPPQPDLAAVGVHIPPPELIRSQYGDYESDDHRAGWFDDHTVEWPADVREAVWLQLAVNVGFYDVAEIELAD